MPPLARERTMRKMQKRLSELPPPPMPAGGKVPSADSAATAVGDIREQLPGTEWFKSSPEAATPVGGVATMDGTALAKHFEAKPLATPATRKLARDLGVDLRNVPPSGDSGRVTKTDVRSFADLPANDGMPTRARTRESDVVPRSETPLTRARIHSEDKGEEVERQPFVGLRRRIAKRMHDATQRTAPFTFVEEVEMDRLKAMVDRLKPTAERRGVKLSYLPFIVKAVTLALQRHPLLNSMLDEERNELVLRRYYHIGIATATEHGLVVPVVKHADRKSPLEIAEEIQRLAEGAREGGLSTDDLKGSTFTITSLGKRGGLLATPVLNYPEVGILGVHRIKERPVVRCGEIVVGNVMLISLSLDHRVVDGDVGANFAYEVIRYLEDPELLLLEMS